MPEVVLSVTDHGLAAQLESDAARAHERVVATTRHFGQLLQSKVKANANTGSHKPGRPHIPGTGPGPNMATGDYNRSIGLEVGTFSDGWAVASVGTDKAQGRRLELGFEGSDSLGRHYSQPPFPHFGPAADEIGPPFADAIEMIGVNP